MGCVRAIDGILSGLLAGAAAGQGDALLIRGAGRSGLLRAVRAEAADRGFTVLTTTSGSLPYGSLPPFPAVRFSGPVHRVRPITASACSGARACAACSAHCCAESAGAAGCSMTMLMHGSEPLARSAPVTPTSRRLTHAT